MTGWTNQVENKLLNFQELKYNKKIQNHHDDSVFSKRCKPFILFLGFCFFIVSFVSAILACVALLSPNVISTSQGGKNQNTSASLLWNYSLSGDSIASSGLEKINYSLSDYGIVLIVFIILSIILIVSFSYSWLHDDFFTSLDKKNKKLWLSLLFGWSIAYLIFLIITAVGISIISLNLYPNNFDDAKTSDSFGLVFYVSSKSISNLNLGISPFGIFVVFLQFVMLFSSIVWIIVFNFKTNLKNLKKLFKHSKK